MIYFSELRGKDVKTDDGISVGKLIDLIFLASDKPVITKIVIKGVLGDKISVPNKFLQKINHDIIITKDYVTSELQENELFMLKNLLDKQIIDLKGHNVVRVNDVVIQDKDELYIAGVDIGILGIFRWFKLENLLLKAANIINFKLSSQFLSWADVRPLELVHGQVKLKKQGERLEKMRPEDLANYLEKTSVTNIRRMLKIVDEKFASEVIQNLNTDYQRAILKRFEPEKSSRLLSMLSSDDAVDILMTFSAKRREEILKFIPDSKKKQLLYLLNLSNTHIGSIMSFDYLTVLPSDSANTVIKKIKEQTLDFFSLVYIYVTDDENQIIGVFSLHELLLHNSDMQVYKFMHENVAFTYLTTPIEIAERKMLKFHLDYLPVIDENKKIQGIISLRNIYEHQLNNK